VVADPASTSRILFVGNSFVSRNDLPGMVARLAASSGHRVETAAIVAGGASLRRHLNSGQVANALSRTRWSHVVLQEQSTLPLKNAARFHQNVRELHVQIDAAGPRTVLYLTWARRSAPAAQVQLTAAAQAIADELDAGMAPVGAAWQHVLQQHPDVELFAADGIHPTAAGSWLAACVLYLTIFEGETLPVSAQPAGVSEAVAAVLAEAARRTTGRS
jgi:lysophospholipase L1-like esterase